MRNSSRAALVALSAAALLSSGVSPSLADPSGHTGPAPALRQFDLQAHRGGIGERTESSLSSFTHALDVGVSTLELDTQVTRDGKVVVTHDRKTNPAVCADTGPATPNDPQYPYVGKFVKDLTLAQLKTLDCGYRQKEGFPNQINTPGSQMIELRDVFALVKSRRATWVRMNIETKVEAGAPSETAPREQFVRTVQREIATSGLRRQVTIQSFDWGALRVMHRLDPRIPLVALTNGDFLEVGKPGRSPWLGGLDVDDFGGDLVAAADAIPGVRAISPVDANPQGCAVDTVECTPYVTADMVRRAHARGLKVIPWTVDEPSTFRYLLRLGVDGIITDYPTTARGLLKEAGYRLPPPVGSLQR
ncbi:glycerophosphodiester phosphodiesterase family protein [Dermacoccaceae bacterium W4C1]